jgi:hypothetical protein
MTMREVIKAQLDQLLDDYDQKRAEAQRLEQKIKEDEQAFLAAFKKVCDTIIRPCMQEVGETLRRRGHDYQIMEEEEALGRDGTARAPRIIINILPARPDNPKARHGLSPALALAASKRKRKVRIHTRSMMPNQSGWSGLRGECDLAQVSPAMVEMELIMLLREVFAKT